MSVESQAWMVRAGRGGYVVEDFERLGAVAIGWIDDSDLGSVSSREELAELVERRLPEKRRAQQISALSQLAALRFDIAAGDSVVTYDPTSREYLLGEVEGGYRYEPATIEGHPHIRPVTWKGRVNRDDLSVGARNTLGAIRTIFRLGKPVCEELWGLLEGTRSLRAIPDDTEGEGFEDLREDVLSRSHEFIKDTILKLDWQQMQELVAGVLRAMGYKTMVSPPGSDLGKDVLASRDGLGFEQPRIRAEVKHRPKEAQGAPQIRSFIAGLRSGDCGLFVSIGGFSKEANYEAERAQAPVTLVDLDRLAALVTGHYESLDSQSRALVPLTRVYWPAL